MITTRTQALAQRAFDAVGAKAANGGDYASFAKSFPAVIQTSGLCQAVALAVIKHPDVLTDLITTLGELLPENARNVPGFAQHCRVAPLQHYVRLSRLSLQAATWLKRYVEAAQVAAVPPPEPAQ